MNTIIQQGTFTSTGAAVELQLRSDIDWMEVTNFTQWGAVQTPGRGVKFNWQRGLAPATSVGTTKSDGANVLQGEVLTGGGFTLLDTTGSPLATLNPTVTAISNASPPVVSNSGTNGLSAGDIVRLTNIVGAQQLGGFDFTVGNGTLTGGTFSLDYMSSIVAGTTGSWRRINFEAQFYPRRRFATVMTKAANAVITMSVAHGFTTGQAVRLIVPASFGMIEMNNLIGNITAITASTITVDINSTAFTTFAWPLTGAGPFTPALVVPIGETANSTYANSLDDATDNVSFIGMKLDAGIDGPAGSSSDVIYWRAGKSSIVNS